MLIRYIKPLLSIFILLTIKLSYGQTSTEKIRFISNGSVGFDAFAAAEWKNEYEVLEDSIPYFVAHKSVAKGTRDSVQFISPYTIDSLDFIIQDSSHQLFYQQINKDTFSLSLPAMDTSYWMRVFKNETLVGKLHVAVYPVDPIEVVVVPLFDVSIDADSLSTYLNRIYGQAAISLSLRIQPPFTPKEFNEELLSNPSPNRDRFTNQMIELREDYFEAHPMKNRPYFVFLINGFMNDSITSYTVRNKAISFVKYTSPTLFRTVARELAVAMGGLDESWKKNGPKPGSTPNLMDLNGRHLTHKQWKHLRSRAGVISYYDDYEDVRTNNGIIAYYLWEEDHNGAIIMRGTTVKNSIKRPFKRNTYSLHLDIDNFLFVPLFTLFAYEICALHLLGILVLATLIVFLYRRWRRKTNFFTRYKVTRWTIRTVFFCTFLFGYYGIFLLVNEGYYLFEVKEGTLDYLNGMTLHDTSIEIRNNVNKRRKQEANMGSEILIKRGNEWSINRKKRVLYLTLDTNNQGKQKCRLTGDSDTLHVATMNFKKYASSHYFVVTHKRKDGGIEKQEVYNHLGNEITDKLKLKDPSKRLLLFVNGYRPTALGSTFEENFNDILENGLEFEDSKNLIYSFDRYNYWESSNAINLLFEKRLNPSESFYADGHHSVATSNHESLIDFTQLLRVYPKRCAKPKQHTCKKSEKKWSLFGLRREINTVDLHHLEPNKKGFGERKNNGRIAGRNLIQIFNEIPNKSFNDTLFVVAHSMGFAYALGILEELRGKIHFGGLYIIAPENAATGTINFSEWQEVWHYGSNFQAHRLNAPCLLDGIAPQSKINGLPNRNRVYIPEQLYSKMGFFNAHYIGHYSWIFDIPKTKKGHIQQR